jgi:hypothetical protein
MKRKGRLLVALAGYVVVFVACAATNDPDAFGVHFQNDLGEPVWLALCQSAHSATCEHPFYRERVSQGSSLPENISPDVRTEWAVESEKGALLRCVALYWKHYPGHDVQLRLSEASLWRVPCAETTSSATARQ